MKDGMVEFRDMFVAMQAANTDTEEAKRADIRREKQAQLEEVQSKAHLRRYLNEKGPMVEQYTKAVDLRFDDIQLEGDAKAREIAAARHAEVMERLSAEASDLAQQRLECIDSGDTVAALLQQCVLCWVVRCPTH